MDDSSAASGMDDCVSDEIREAGWNHLESLGKHYDGAYDPTLVFLM